ncbi:MAG: hypothetical protein ACE5RQ_02720 [Nitrosopumilus sp.]|uniref:Uncharacterized protein n=1 Tax=Candidatus Nitrosomaritimum aestuariumsis TaxID=3342354 RepID=A0AC60VX88_9ARCH|nr:hypothetical protein [Nitrosopumilaceae archaeon]MBA4461414.1 hypothetical protein [Nitrosopumilaceae archaeon]NCF21862.1 hypothetical protein [Nitrosopumilaceae archaeon]
MVQTLKLVFSNWRYSLLAVGIFASMLVGLLILSEYIFLEPYVTGHIPKGTEFGFSLIIILSGLAALVLPMNVYRINILKNSTKKIGGSVFGSFIGAAAGACSCGPIGFAVISTFGSVGATSLTFLTNYEIPIRLAAIGLLGITYYTTVKSLKVECKLKPQ